MTRVLLRMACAVMEATVQATALAVMAQTALIAGLVPLRRLVVSMRVRILFPTAFAMMEELVRNTTSAFMVQTALTVDPVMSVSAVLISNQ